jgi:hypothetical protein
MARLEVRLRRTSTIPRPLGTPNYRLLSGIALSSGEPNSAIGVDRRDEPRISGLLRVGPMNSVRLFGVPVHPLAPCGVTVTPFWR